MKAILFIFLIFVVAIHCGEKHQRCIRKTEELSCSDYSEIYNHIDDFIKSKRPTSELVTANPTAALFAGKIVGGFVRLAFHDAVEFKRSSKNHLRADGCINLEDPGHAGLERTIEIVNDLWRPFCTKISRADFWFLAAKVAIETSVPYIDFDNSLGAAETKKRNQPKDSELSYFNIPFYYGRETIDNCTYQGKSRLPDADGTSKEYERVFFRNLGLSVRETVALVGAHTLGSLSVQNSGYNGIWKSRTDIFDTEYFFNLLKKKWEPQILSSPQGKIINQWIVKDASLEDANVVMINTDIELLYSIDPQESRRTKNTCGPYDQNAVTDSCPHTSQEHDYNFNYFAEKYFEGHAVNDNDLPGSARWLSDFARAFKKLGSVGYKTKDSLVCAQCNTRVCPSDKCGKKELCEGPSYGYFADPPNHQY